MAKVKKKKSNGIDMTLWGVILSYPDLANPKPYKGKTYYKTDCLMDLDHPQLGDLREKIKDLRVENWGDDKTEWPEDAAKQFIKNGDEHEDSKGYKGKKYISVATQQPVPVVDPKGKPFNPATVKGGMTANVAIRLATWDNEGDEGMSIYLQGIQIDTSVPSLNFGGGKSVQQMFKRDDEDESEEDQDEDESEDDSEEDDEPRGKKKKSKKPVDEDDDEDSEDEQDEDEDDEPKKKKKKSKPVDEDDDED